MKPKILKVIFAVFSVFLLNNTVSYSQWFGLTTNTSASLYDICFINANTGIAVGSGGVIIRTINAGQNWSIIGSGTSNPLFSLVFPEELTGYTGGNTGVVLRTLNGGASWNPRAGCSINIRSISFLNVNTGITAGGGTLMCYTTDGGQSWNPRYAPQFAVTGVTFLNSTTLLTSATDMPGAVIYKSTNSGYNWSTVHTLNNSGLDVMYSLGCIYFKDALTGFSTGSCISYSQMWGHIYKTINGGDNWSLSGVTPSAANSCINGIYFGDPSTGFAAGNNGVIMRSTNSGSNWDVQSTGTTTVLNSIYMLNALTGYACGNNGIILKTTNGGVTGFINSNGTIPGEYYLHQNYPNPFNPSTKIKIDITKSSFVKLAVYDILGREVTILINEQMQPGSYEVECDASGYFSGVYFYKLTAGDPSTGSGPGYSETKKMIIIK